VTLHAAVDRALLQEALDALMPRFPYFRVRLRKGLFWHYLEERSGAPRVQTESRAPCRGMTRTGDDAWQLRVLVFDRRIAVEFSHVLTDGAAALEFLRALLAEYLARCGVAIPADARIMRPGDQPHAGEAEDAYRRFYDPRVPPRPIGVRALHLGGTPLPPGDCRIVLGVVPVARLRELSNTHRVTLTELLAAVLLAAVADVAGAARAPLAVMVPVNLRRLFPSRTMRNFFLPVVVSIDLRLGAYSFEEILHDVHHSARAQVSAKSVSRQIRRNVGAERNAVIRHVPLLLKVPANRRLYASRWGARSTTVLSNLGRVDLPRSLDEHVERFDVIPNPSAAHGIGCAILGYREHLFITFASIVSGTGLERAFFTRLRRMGITARIETN